MTAATVDTVTEHERWSKASSRYQERIGKTTSVGTERLVDIVNKLSPFDSDSRVLDNGAGGGSLTIKVVEKSSTTRVLATDLSVGMLEVIDNLKLRGVTTQREDAVTLSCLSNDSFSHVMSSFMIQYTPDAHATLASMYRVLAPGGIAGIAIWGPRTIADIHDKACYRLKPTYKSAPPSAAGSWSSKEDHKIALDKAGFKDVAIDTVWMPFECKNADHFLDYWFGYGNPVPRKMIEHWTAAGGDLEALKDEVRKVVQEEYADGADIGFEAVLGWGSK